jgi:hypothetical protein
MTEWRIGPEGGHTIYRDGRLIGIMLHPADAHLAVAQVNSHHSTVELRDAFQRMEHKIVGALEDLQAADAVLGQTVTTLVEEQATFLTNVAAALLAAGTDPAALAAVTADITAQAQTLTSLVEAQRAADPGPAV